MTGARAPHLNDGLNGRRHIYAIWIVLEAIPKAPARHVFVRNPRNAIRRPVVENLDDVRMRERRSDLGLVVEPLNLFLLFEYVGEQQLDGYGSAKLPVGGQQIRAEAAARDSTQELVLVRTVGWQRIFVG